MLSLFDRLKNPERRSQLVNDPEQAAKLYEMEANVLNKVIESDMNHSQNPFFYILNY